MVSHPASYIRTKTFKHDNICHQVENIHEQQAISEQKLLSTEAQQDYDVVIKACKPKTLVKYKDKVPKHLREILRSWFNTIRTEY